MNLKQHTLAIGIAAISVLTTTVPSISALGGQNERSSKSPVAEARTIKGAWRTVVTGRNCQTGEPFGSLPGLFTFNEGGTMSEYGIGPGASPALRSPGHGVWQRERSWNDYSFAFTYYRYNAGGAFVGSQSVTGSLELGSSDDEFETTSTIEILDVNGNPIGAGCATAVGRRFERR
jgi:hypothetical protein